MINAAETQPPKAQLSKINAAETIPPHIAGSNTINFLSGETVADSFVINSLMEKQGKQSNVYLAKKWGKNYVVKVYKNGWKPSEKMQAFLTSVSHPNIAHVVECGIHNGNYYEIYDYYASGTLEEAKELSNAHIQNVIVPSINEGLHELHRNGIVHCDIKPSNLFYNNEGNRILIGDCGISGYTNSNGKLVDGMRGTPEYAPRVKSLLWSASMSPSYDYGSFGLVLCKAILGHSIFAGMSVEEIARAWENGIELPSKISGRLLVLIKGLINEDEDQRWGYQQVKRWCEGEYMRPANRSIYARPKKNQNNRPLIFGHFDGEVLTVNSLHQLAIAIKEHWNQATKVIKRRELVEFVRQYDSNLADEVRKLSLLQDADSAVFRLLQNIDDEEEIRYCDKKYASLSDYVECLASGCDEYAKRFLASGLLVFYLRKKDYDKTQVDRLEQLIQRNGCNDMTAISTICFALQGKKSIEIFGTDVGSLNKLVQTISSRSIVDICKLLEDDRFIAWINRLGYEREMKRLKEVE